MCANVAAWTALALVTHPGKNRQIVDFPEVGHSLTRGSQILSYKYETLHFQKSFLPYEKLFKNIVHTRSQRNIPEWLWGEEGCGEEIARNDVSEPNRGNDGLLDSESSSSNLEDPQCPSMVFGDTHATSQRRLVILPLWNSHDPTHPSNKD